MESTFYALTFILTTFTFLPLIRHPHWTVRVVDFGKIQLLFLQVIFLILGFLFLELNLCTILAGLSLLVSLVYNGIILYDYSFFASKRSKKCSKKSSNLISLLSVNVYQYSTDYNKFIDLVLEEKPMFFLTVESNQAWEDALVILENDYPFHYKIAQENTYGMHFYSKVKIKKAQEHYFVANDIPSLEMDLETEDGFYFSVFCVHPPPPSPTEEETSKERDGELMAVAKRVLKKTTPSIVIGDFNDVSWSQSSVMFKKVAQLIDARKGRGVLSTFHANYWLFRFPLDLIYHSDSIYIEKIAVLKNVGSDHLPIKCIFYLEDEKEKKEDIKESLLEEAEERIQEGKEVESDR